MSVLSSRVSMSHLAIVVALASLSLAAVRCDESGEVAGGGAGTPGGSGGTGSGGTGGTGPQPCLQDSNCEQSQVCRNNLCVDNSCEIDDDCPAGQSCDTLTGACTGGTGGNGGGGGGGTGGIGGIGGDGGQVLACVDRYDCGVGEICTAGSCTTQPANCGVPSDCGNGNICLNGTCVPGCESNADCAHDLAAARCNLGAGTCEACRLSIDCPPGATCNAGSCAAAPGCANADSCPAGQGCVAGACAACAGAADCRVGPPAEECSLPAGFCRTVGCTAEQCAQIGATWFCDGGTGQCFSGCAGDADCFGGQTCNVVTHQCGGGGGNCTQTGCPQGQTCNAATGACEAQDCCAGLVCPGGEGCSPDGAGGCGCVAEACCTNAACEVNGQACVIDSPGVCHCSGGGAGCADQAAADACDQNCLQAFQTCDYNTCTCGGGGGGGCGSANCDACCGGACTQVPGFCDDGFLLFICLAAGACP